MTDREMLELAAKACGLPVGAAQKGSWFYSEVGGQFGEGVYRIHGNLMEFWNPLKDDGDALRLAVMRQFGVFTNIQRGISWVCDKHGNNIAEVLHGDPVMYDPYAATRRAITRAAAEIGKGME